MKRKLESMEDLLQAVEYYGFLPFFPNDIPGFSVEEMCAPAYWFAEDRDGPWEWKGPAAQTKRCAYGKLFRKKAGFVSREWLPELVNFRRDGYDFDARCDDGLVFHKDEELYNTVHARRAKFFQNSSKRSSITAKAATRALKRASRGCKCRRICAFRILSA